MAFHCKSPYYGKCIIAFRKWFKNRFLNPRDSVCTENICIDSSFLTCSEKRTVIMEEWLLLPSVSLSLWDFTYNQITTFPLKLNPLFRLLWKITGVSAGICTEQIPRCDFGEIGVKSNLNLASAQQFIWSLMDLDTHAYKLWSYVFTFFPFECELKAVALPWVLLQPNRNMIESTQWRHLLSTSSH